MNALDKAILDTEVQIAQAKAHLSEIQNGLNELYLQRVKRDWGVEVGSHVVRHQHSKAPDRGVVARIRHIEHANAKPWLVVYPFLKGGGVSTHTRNWYGAWEASP